MEGAGAGAQANLSSGKCIQMNVVILSNILRDAAARLLLLLLLMQQLLHKTQVQHFNGSPPVHATNSGTSTTGLTHALEI